MTQSKLDAIKAKLEEVKKRADGADRLICDLASGKKKWQMCVPPQADDSDMVLVEPVRTDVPTLIACLERAVEALTYVDEYAGDIPERQECREAIADIADMLEVKS